MIEDWVVGLVLLYLAVILGQQLLPKIRTLSRAGRADPRPHRRGSVPVQKLTA